jgi:aminoglycoside phosphotransferase (APT) family kinase protein
VRCHAASDSTAGPRLVIRLPPLVASFPDHDFGLQARVQAAASAAGIPTATPITLKEDPGWLGVPFMAVPFVDGDIPGPASLFDPWLNDATPDEQREAQREMVRVLAAVHGVDWHRFGLGEMLDANRSGLADHLDGLASLRSSLFGHLSGG